MLRVWGSRRPWEVGAEACPLGRRIREQGLVNHQPLRPRTRLRPGQGDWPFQPVSALVRWLEVRQGWRKWRLVLVDQERDKDSPRGSKFARGTCSSDKVRLTQAVIL